MSSPIFPVRLPPEERDLLQIAAELEGVSIASFIKRAALEKAAEIMGCETPKPRRPGPMPRRARKTGSL